MSQVSHVKSMEAAEAAKALESALAGHRGDLTIADASAKSGLALRDAELGMHSLLSTYRGHLRVTEEGELLFRFPHGFTKPWETRTRIEKAAKAAGKVAVGIGRFVVRAWISVVLIGYVAIFVALMIALAFAQSNDNRRGRSSFDGFGGYLVMRIIFDALFWTFHPFSPVSMHAGRGYGFDQSRRRASSDGVPFYEKVNRFFFGPPVKEPDPRAMERAIVAEIRAQKGRIGLADVIRVTGLPRDEADPMMARLMLDYDGTVEVTDNGAIVYRFESIRKTAASEPVEPAPKAIWTKIQRLAPLTGNTAGTNGLIIALNGFNLIMSTYAMSAGLTIERVFAIIEQSRQPPPHFIPPPETAIALGVVPFVFSIALFALPLGRVLYRRHRAKVVARENGRRAVLREIIENASTTTLITDEVLKGAWQGASGAEPNTKQITREVVALGGDVDVTEAGVVRYRFPELEAEAEALEAEREAASEAEAKVGKVIFSSDE
jgi:hypothetical protein